MNSCEDWRHIAAVRDSDEWIVVPHSGKPLLYTPSPRSPPGVRFVLAVLGFNARGCSGSLRPATAPQGGYLSRHVLEAIRAWHARGSGADTYCGAESLSLSFVQLPSVYRLSFDFDHSPLSNVL